MSKSNIIIMFSAAIAFALLSPVAIRALTAAPQATSIDPVLTVEYKK
jgi:hypothetical protein